MGMKFDLDALVTTGEFGEVGAEQSLKSKEDSHDRLAEFVNKHKSYLRLYNPTVVIYSQEVQEDFLKNLQEIRSLVLPLEMTRVLSELENLKDMVANTNEKGLSDGLVKFFATMEIVASKISQAMTEDVPNNTELSRGKKTEKEIIIAVDDRPEILTTLVGILGDEYKVIAMTDGLLALKATEIYSPSLFLLDIEMEDMNGFELAEKIRRDNRFKNTPILFLTSSAKRDYVLSAKTFGASEYILKPVNRDMLLHKIKYYLT